MKTKSSKPDPIKEAEALKSLRNLSREEVMAAALWELARFAYFQNMLPEFWRKTAEKCRPESTIARCSEDDLLGHLNFPHTRWGKLDAKAQAAIVSHHYGDQSTGAEFMSGLDAWNQASRFVKDYEDRAKEPLPESGSRQIHSPSFFKMEDDGIVVLLRVFPKCGWNKIASDIIAELKKLNVSTLPQDGRRNANDKATNEVILDGLASLWLKEAGKSKRDRNKAIYPTQEKKSDYGSLRKAEKRAEDELASFVEKLSSACEPWTKAKKEEMRRDRARDRRLARIGGPKTKPRKDRA